MYHLIAEKALAVEEGSKGLINSGNIKFSPLSTDPPPLWAMENKIIQSYKVSGVGPPIQSIGGKTKFIGMLPLFGGRTQFWVSTPTSGVHLSPHGWIQSSLE